MKINYQSLVGETIASVSKMKKPGFDDQGWLRLEFTDGSACIVVASYGGYTGKSANVFPTNIEVVSDEEMLIPVVSTKSK
jgi:hypothetical protein